MGDVSISTVRCGAARLGEAAEEMRAASHLVSGAIAPGWRGAAWAAFQLERERQARSLSRQAGVLAACAGATRRYARGLEVAEGLRVADPAGSTAARVIAERRYALALSGEGSVVAGVRDALPDLRDFGSAVTSASGALGTAVRLGRVAAGYLGGRSRGELVQQLMRATSWVEKLPGGRLIARLLPVTSWVTGAKDVYDGGGYGGWRGAVTRVVAGNYLASQAVRGKVPHLGVLIWASVSDSLYDAWSTGNYVYDRRHVISPALTRAYRWARGELQGIAQRGVPSRHRPILPLPLLAVAYTAAKHTGDGLQAAGQYAGKRASEVRDSAGRRAGEVREAVGGAAGEVRDAVGGAARDVRDAAEDVGATVGSAADATRDAAVDTTKGVVRGVIRAIDVIPRVRFAW